MKISPKQHISVKNRKESAKEKDHELTFLIPPGNYIFKVNNRNTRAICSKLTIKIPERRQWLHSGIFIVNFEHISHLVLVFLLLTLSM